MPANAFAPAEQRREAACWSWPTPDATPGPRKSSGSWRTAVACSPPIRSCGANRSPAARTPSYTYALFIAAVGERPLGIQAAQLAALARWARARDDQPIEIVAIGPRAATAALVASAIEPQAIAGLELGDALASLKELIERNVAAEAMPELFAFGLLAECDIMQLVAMAAPRPVRFRDLSERASRRFDPLEAWYALFGATYERPHESP